MAASNGKPSHVEIRVLRQEGPGQTSHWERHRLPYEPDLNITSVLQKLAARAATVDGTPVAPIAYESNCLEEVCGACTMVINGRVRQACSTLVDKLLLENPIEIELRPMSKFTVLRDLVVERQRLFRSLQRVHAWVPVDDYFDRGPGPRQSEEQQETAYPLTECMSCGCCLEACPQFTRIDVLAEEGESDAEWRARANQAYDRGFVGAHAISQAMLFNDNPIGRMTAPERLEALISEGGIQMCGNAQNCAAVCPKEIPLTRSIARAGRATTIHTIKKWFDR